MELFKKKEAPDTKPLTSEQVNHAFGVIQAQFAEQGEQMRTLMQGISDVTGVVSNLGKAAIPADPAATPPTEQQAPAGPTGEDIEAMTQGELVTHILGGVAEMVQGQADVSKKETDALAARQRSSAVAQQMKDIAGTKGSEDFWDWKDEIAALHKEGISTDPATLYHEARRRNPEKQLATDKQYEQNGQTKEDEKEQSTSNLPESLFGGMSPTNGGSEAEANEDFANAIEAGNAVFDEAFEELPEQLWKN